MISAAAVLIELVRHAGLPAFRAKLDLGVHVGAALDAFHLRRHRLPALGTELGRAHVGATLRAKTGGVLLHVDVLDQVHFPRLVPELLFCDLGLDRRCLFAQIRRAVLAKLTLLVPAGVRTNPFAATSALAELRLHFLDGLAERVVVSFSANRPVDFVGAGSGAAQHPAEEVARGIEQAIRHSERVGLVLRDEAVPAFVAIELELEALVGGQVIVVPGELNRAHHTLLAGLLARDPSPTLVWFSRIRIIVETRGGSPLKMTVFKKALTGFNHNIKHKGQVYHIQTEDSGVNNPHIITHLFVGGNILASKKTSYADILTAENLTEVVYELMKEQHTEVLRNLLAGVYDGVDDGAKAYQPGQLGLGDRPSLRSGVRAEPKIVPPEVIAAKQLKETPKIREGGETIFGEDLISEKTLDEVILQYLGGDGDEK
jgi:hypothetical protein